MNKAIERNQWYSRMIDDILPELAKSKYKTLKDATSGYWHIVLDLASSLLTMFNSPWGKFRWLRLPFGLKIASDVFQERLDRMQGSHSSWKTWKNDNSFPVLEKYWNCIILLKILENGSEPGKKLV